MCAPVTDGRDKHLPCANPRYNNNIRDDDEQKRTETHKRVAQRGNRKSVLDDGLFTLFFFVVELLSSSSSPFGRIFFL